MCSTMQGKQHATFFCCSMSLGGGLSTALNDAVAAAVAKVRMGNFVNVFTYRIACTVKTPRRGRFELFYPPY